MCMCLVTSSFMSKNGVTKKYEYEERGDTPEKERRGVKMNDVQTKKEPLIGFVIEYDEKRLTD